MARFTRRRLICVIALLCQVASAAHTPMLQAKTAGSAPAAFAHCAEHAPPSGTQGSEHVPQGTGHNGHAHPGWCCCGLCQCPCAQAAALLSALPEPSAAQHVTVTLVYRLPEMPQLGTAFFRPPI